MEGLFHEFKKFSRLRVNTGVILEGDVGEVISNDCPTSPFFQLREKWFYIEDIERIFQKTITSLQSYRKRSKLLPV